MNYVKWILDAIELVKHPPISELLDDDLLENIIKETTKKEPRSRGKNRTAEPKKIDQELNQKILAAMNRLLDNMTKITVIAGNNPDIDIYTYSEVMMLMANRFDEQERSEEFLKDIEDFNRELEAVYLKANEAKAV